MEVFVNGQKVSLNQSNFVAKGSEGSIFKRNGTAYKIYEDISDFSGQLKLPASFY